MYVLRNRAGFSIAGYQWDVLVEHGSSELDAAGHAKGADIPELWQWLAGQLGGVMLDTADGRGLTTRHNPEEQPAELLVRQLYERPEWWTAERMAAHLLLEFRKLSSAVQAVSVTTGLHTAAMRTVTVRTNETRPVTQEELVAAFRRLAQMNTSLVLNAGGR